MNFDFLSEDTKRIITNGVKKYCDKDGTYIVPKEKINEIVLSDKRVGYMLESFQVKTLNDFDKFLSNKEQIEDYIDMRFFYELERTLVELILEDFIDFTKENKINIEVDTKYSEIYEDLWDDLDTDFPDSLKSVGYSGNLKIDIDYIINYIDKEYRNYIEVDT